MRCSNNRLTATARVQLGSRTGEVVEEGDSRGNSGQSSCTSVTPHAGNGSRGPNDPGPRGCGAPRRARETAKSDIARRPSYTPNL